MFQIKQVLSFLCIGLSTMPDFHFKEMEPGGMGATEEDKVSSFRSDLVTAQVLLIAITSGTACAVALFFKAYAKYPYICLAQVLTGAVAAGLDFALRASSGELRALGYLGFTRRIAVGRHQNRRRFARH